MSGFGDRQPMKDPFGLPTDEADACPDGGEFDLSLLEPKTRSIAVAPPPSMLAAQRSSSSAMNEQCRLPGFKAPEQALKAPQSSTSLNHDSVAGKAHNVNVKKMEEVRGAAKEVTLEPPALPFDCSIFPLEVCHFHSRKSPQELKDDIEEGLQSHNVAFEFDAQKFRFCCEYFAGTSVVKFYVRAYRMPDRRLAVEFQRRQGCCLACSKIVSAVREAVQPEEDLKRGNDDSFAPVVTEASVLLARCNEMGPVSPEVMSTKLDELRQCLSCGREDVKREFAKVLIPLSQLCPQSVRKERSYAELVAQLFASDVDEVRLSAVSCVANIAASLKEQDEEEGDGWFGDVLDMVVRALADPNAHVRREAARALMYMSRRFMDAIVSHGGLEALRRYSQCSDRTLSGYCSAAVHNLVPVC